ncbi:UilS family quorum-quenching N-acyl-homoserine lactonase [Erwinia sp. HR93]|uniref:UilS family quorum-quenching N-acyl-homoserine lactonase n=1 Tax=Erwinia sp. HR93 TaxID=3094840 RepID=UPI002ADED379|nr:alpha/beta fold hydrolase [Erwinia sp. HR93]MEA1063343.1 alpha/beta fold hydrolase [Erwinia sp. HR93]
MTTTTHQLDNGISLTVYHPAPCDTPQPAVVLCHGFCGIQGLLLPAFAQAFAQAGYLSVTFDYHGFGASEGERGRLVPALQIDDIVSVLQWVSARPEVDESRIGLWGTSLGGAHVFGAARLYPQVKCIISQLAFADGEAIVTGAMTDEEKRGFVESLDKMAQKKAATGKEMFVSITRVLNDEESRAFFDSHKADWPAMDIKIPFLTVRETLLYKPQENARQVTCPTLIVVAGEDTVNPPAQGEALFQAVGAANKRLYREEGARHYDVYRGTHFEAVIAQQLVWFADNL